MHDDSSDGRGREPRRRFLRRRCIPTCSWGCGTVVELFVAAYPALAGRAVREPDLRSSTARVIVDTISYLSDCAVDRSDVAVPCFPRVAFRGKARTRAQRRRASCDRVARLLWDMWAGRWQRAYVLGVYVVTAQHVDRARSSWHAEGG